MPPNTEKEFLIKVRADIRQGVAELRKLSKEVKDTGDRSDKSSKDVGRMASTINTLTAAAGGYLSLRFAKALLDQADAFNVLQDRIRTATKETGDYQAVSKQLYDLANETGTALSSTVDLYQAIARAQDDLGASNQQIIELINNVQKLGVIGGASGASLSGSILQFTQLMGGSVVQAQEFNSIMDGMPELTKRLADGMGKTVGQLRHAVNQGEVLSKDVFNILLRQTQQINSDFAELPDRLNRSTTALSNSFARFLSKLDQAAEGTGNLAKLFRFAAAGLDAWSEIIGESEFQEVMRERRNIMADLLSVQEKINKGELSGEFLKGAEQQAARLRKELQEIDQRMVALGRAEVATLGDVGGGSGTGTGNADTETPEEKAARERIEKNIQALQIEAQAFGASRTAVELYKLALAGATGEQLNQAAAALQAIEAQQQVLDGQEDAQLRLQRLVDEGKDLYESTRTDQEQLANDWARFDDRLEKGIIDFDTYARAVFGAQDALDDLKDTGTDAMDELIAAAKGWGDEFTNTLADMVVDGKASFKDLADAIIKDLLKIAIYQTITKPILQEFGVIEVAEGGLIRGPGSSTSDSIPARLSDGEYVQPAHAVEYYGAGFMEQIRRLQVPRFASGGMVSIRRPSVARFAEGGLVDAPAGINGSGISVEIINRDTGKKVNQSGTQFDPKRMVLTVMLDDVDGDGAFTGKLADKFGLQRRAR